MPFHILGVSSGLVKISNPSSPVYPVLEVIVSIPRTGIF